MGSAKSRLGNGANKVLKKEMPNNVFVKQGNTEDNNVKQGNTKLNEKGKTYFAVRMTPKETVYMDKMKDRNQITGAAAFHLIMAEYMRGHPL